MKIVAEPPSVCASPGYGQIDYQWHGLLFLLRLFTLNESINVLLLYIAQSEACRWPTKQHYSHIKIFELTNDKQIHCFNTIDLIWTQIFLIKLVIGMLPLNLSGSELEKIDLSVERTIYWNKIYFISSTLEKMKWSERDHLFWHWIPSTTQIFCHNTLQREHSIVRIVLVFGQSFTRISSTQFSKLFILYTEDSEYWRISLQKG